MTFIISFVPVEAQFMNGFHKQAFSKILLLFVNSIGWWKELHLYFLHSHKYDYLFQNCKTNYVYEQRYYCVSSLILLIINLNSFLNSSAMILSKFTVWLILFCPLLPAGLALGNLEFGEVLCCISPPVSIVFVCLLCAEVFYAQSLKTLLLV